VDLRTFRIPNALVLAGAAFGLVIQTWGGGIDGLWQALAGLALGLGLLFPLYAIGHMGAGDVKLAGAAGALLGPGQFLVAGLLAILAAGVMGAVYALAAWRRRGATGPWRRYGQMFRFLLVTGRPGYLPPASGEAMAERLPLAVPIAVGGSVALLWPNVLNLLPL
jgi:prepilin peptidase CpaA